MADSCQRDSFLDHFQSRIQTLLQNKLIRADAAAPFKRMHERILIHKKVTGQLVDGDGFLQMLQNILTYHGRQLKIRAVPVKGIDGRSAVAPADLHKQFRQIGPSQKTVAWIRTGINGKQAVKEIENTAVDLLGIVIYGKNIFRKTLAEI